MMMMMCFVLQFVSKKVFSVFFGAFERREGLLVAEKYLGAVSQVMRAVTDTKSTLQLHKLPANHILWDPFG